MEAVYVKLYDYFVEPFDAHDNGISAYPPDIRPLFHHSWDIFSQVNILNPAWNEQNVNVDARFLEAIGLVRSNFEKVLDYLCHSWLPGRNLMRLNLERNDIWCGDPRLLILNEYCPWIELVFEAEEEENTPGRFVYVIYEDSTKTSWRIQAVSKSPDSFESRMALPIEWRGLRDAELDSTTGIEGCIFVHRSGFIGGHRTKEGAISMAQKALQSTET